MALKEKEAKFWNREIEEKEETLLEQKERKFTVGSYLDSQCPSTPCSWYQSRVPRSAMMR